ncbi:MAG: FlgD immunoglobulin-like domain containing protein [Candidatus Limnocylindrales bacterium]
MTEQHRAPAATSSHRALRKDVIRALVILLAIVALVLTSSALNLVPGVSAAEGVKKAVIVAGPVHSLTAKYKAYAKDIADAAEAQGMETIRIFHPYAPAKRVRNQAQGADLFVYVGHGNGWPSPYGPFQEDTKNGLGLDPLDKEKRSPNTVIYKGANWLRDNLELAPNAVVILSHLSYASGNASSGMPIPTRSVAVQRVDNFANGFLSIGARVVWALGWQPGADIVDALHTEDATMDAVFQTRYREPVNPRNGWIGHDPGYYDSERIPGARIHIDPHPSEGYLRGVTGDLAFTTTAWRDATAQPPDTTAPVVSELRVSQAPGTISTASSSAPVFTPNGDGLSDTIGIAYKLSEGAFLELKVKRDGKVVRRASSWALGGAGSVVWNGRNDNGRYAAEGKYNVFLTPTDKAGNKGAPKSVSVRLLNSVKNPKASRELFWARDGDGLAATTALKARLTRTAAVSWIVRNRQGTIVRRGIVNEERPAGDVRFVWDGTNDDGKPVPSGLYTARVKVQTAAGWYAHELKVRNMPFKAWTRTWTRQRGDTVTLKVTSAEPLQRKPVVTANQKGIAKYTVPPKKVRKVGTNLYKVVIKTKAKSKPGGMAVRVTGVDKGGGTNTKVFTIKLT